MDWRFGLTSTEEPEVTVLAASAREYRVTVATDAVAALEDLTQRACFEIWRRKFARHAGIDGVVAELRESGGRTL